MSGLVAVYDPSVVIDVSEVDLGVYGDGPAVISAISIGELASGVDGPDRDAREARLLHVLRGYEVLPFGVEAAKIYGVLAGMLRAIGRNPRPRRLDLQIAATAAAAAHPQPGRLPRALAAGRRRPDPPHRLIAASGILYPWRRGGTCCGRRRTPG